MELKYPEDYIGKIICGNCLEVLKSFPDNSINACITDPPYELGFMGKEWDKKGIAYNIDLWKEVLRVLKPGGHLLSFGGSRTYHRMACAIEDAGFEIRDMINWVYGSGFPKSLNIGKAIDRMQGNERVKTGENPNHRNKENYRGVLKDMNPHSGDGSLTKGNSDWEGWGTALKPAHEPIVVARKPLGEKTVAENVLKWGTGGLNIDGCRISLNDEKPPKGSAKRVYKSNKYTEEKIYGDNKQTSFQGRFPANLIHDGSPEVMAEFEKAGNRGAFAPVRKGYTGKSKGIYGDYAQRGDDGATFYNDGLGSPARFFYCAKASKSERNNGNGNNNHPTVKPITLMKYLIKLVTREGQIVLDCFAGSGSTLIACKELNRRFIGIEISPEYVEIAEQRLAGNNLMLDI